MKIAQEAVIDSVFSEEAQTTVAFSVSTGGIVWRHGKLILLGCEHDLRPRDKIMIEISLENRHK